MQGGLFSLKFIFLATGGGYKGLLADFDTMFWSGVLRIVYAIVSSAPFLVSGLVITGLLRVLLALLELKDYSVWGNGTAPMALVPRFVNPNLFIWCFACGPRTAPVWRSEGQLLVL